MEVCVDSVKTALDAVVGGAIRIQLCSGIDEGCLTPSLGLFIIIRKMVHIPIFVVIRPSNSTNFKYTINEIDAMKKDIFLFKKNGADGFVFGVLKRHKTVDKIACKTLLDAASPLPVTFNRAFDFIHEPYEALDIIINLGFKGILTSGRAYTVDKGFNLIRNLVLLAKNRINIIPASGITQYNLKRILDNTKALEIHFIPYETITPKQMLKMAAVLQQHKMHETKLLQSCRFGGFKLDTKRYFTNFHYL